MNVMHTERNETDRSVADTVPCIYDPSGPGLPITLLHPPTEEIE